ncbi:TOMM precursor leader peptide-binding protein [Actinacidiphila acididurans]|uniref:TOMM leader peptide-binding protein n=1 Tax=Actinacidiphila acididurans TaxID=2784346 RepID=A0ABS2TUG6_9ACTN|nr:TOMM precursor leader peptide-binding protein [Actinacidiphila acididurans]MBM9506979.1 TOMM precursor leader peptide-binding protein [Actinacidiphila acididurans]
MTLTPLAGPDAEAPAGAGPLAAAGRDLAAKLAAHAARAGRPAPAVAVLGDHDVLRPEPDAAAAHRAAAAVHLTPDAVLIGPWGGDGSEPACGGCLAVRWQRLRTRTEREALETGLDVAAAGAWPVLPDWTADAVWALHEWTAGQAARTGGLPRVTRYDLETGRVGTVPLLAEPLCEGHLRPAASAAPFAEPPRLTARPKPGPDRYRLRAPASYALPTAALANPVCGVLGAGTWLDVTSPTTAPVAGSVFMRGYAGLTDVTWSGQANSFAASRDLAFLEGLERYAGTHRRDAEPPLVASYESLGATALDPRDCGLYAPETYRDDDMVAPFDPARPIPWVRGHSLRDDRPVWVPARLAYYSAGTPADNFVFECSNGCAIGGSLEEAVLFGLLELIERDAFLLGWYGDAPLTEIDLASCAAPEIRAMADRAALCGYDVHVYDNRIDLPVPVVTGLAVRRDDGPGTLAFAAGAAFDPETAVAAAVSEILTYLPHLPRQVGERPAELEAMAGDFTRVRRLADHAALFGLPRMKRHVRGYLEPAAVRPLAEVYRSWQQDRPRGTDLREDVLWLRDVLAGAGFDVIVVDQTTPEQRRYGLTTVCTIVPGLLPIDFGWTRQRALTMPRLRTAQRRAGLRPADLAEHEIRRVPHPFP